MFVSIYLYLKYIKQVNTYTMTTITITVNGNKPGQKIFFILNVPKANFFNVVDMTFETIEDVLKAESEGHFQISK